MNDTTRLLIASIGWLVLCGIAGVWAWRRVKKSDIEEDHEEALELDKVWNVYIAPPPVPPILNQSERWQERARKAESLGFLDSFEDEPRPAA